MKPTQYQTMIDDLCEKGYELASKIIEEETVTDESIPIVEVNNEYPEKLGAISGFIEVLIKAKSSI